jgi:hypothetical protein
MLKLTLVNHEGYGFSTLDFTEWTMEVGFTAFSFSTSPTGRNQLSAGREDHCQENLYVSCGNDRSITQQSVRKDKQRMKNIKRKNKINVRCKLSVKAGA